MRTNRNIRLISLYEMARSMMFLLPVIVPFYRDALGLDFKAFMIGEAVFSAVIIAMEVPTGWLADIWKRKHILILAGAFDILGWALLLNAHESWIAWAAQGVLGIGISLMSGTISALLYDTLLEAGREDEFHRREGKRFATGFYTLAISCIVGAFLYEMDAKLPLLVMLGVSVGKMGVALLLTEPSRHKRQIENHPLADMLQTMRYALHGHKEIAMLIFVGAVMFSGTKLLMWAQQPYYMALGVPESWFGALMACGFLVSGIAGHTSHFYARFSNRRVLAALMGFEIFVALAAGFSLGAHGVVLLLAGYIVYGTASPRLQDALNRRTDSARRATVLSTASLMVHFLSVPLMAIFGWLAEGDNIGSALLALGAFVLVAGVPCLIAVGRVENPASKT